MYYRYKSKKKDRKFLKIFIMSILIGVALYLGYNFQSELMFWRIDRNRIIDQIDKISSITDSEKKIAYIKQLSEDVEAYKSENPLDVDSYIYSARVFYHLSFALFGKSFTEMYIDDSLYTISSEQKRYFIKSINSMSKAIAILDGRNIELQDMLILCKSYFFTGYKENSTILSMLKGFSSSIDKLSVDDIRFDSIICLSVGNVDEGIDILDKKGKVDESVPGRLFKAKALTNSHRYTEAIIAFQNILKTTDDPAIKKISFTNLGKIYYNQNLFKESLDQFAFALDLGDDVNCKLWIGKNYLAMGMKDKAKAVWSEINTVNDAVNDNEEAKRYMNSI
ncbi:MAG: hypothetical protein FWH53_03065 [Leptospirales bacterium]|nr:hypothetical protein [Leptospirales bacterium]